MKRVQSMSNSIKQSLVDAPVSLDREIAIIALHYPMTFTASDQSTKTEPVPKMNKREVWFVKKLPGAKAYLIDGLDDIQVFNSFIDSYSYSYDLINSIERLFLVTQTNTSYQSAQVAYRHIDTFIKEVARLQRFPLLSELLQQWRASGMHMISIDWVQDESRLTSNQLF